ncbi:hypothetical protein OQA88_739 [Cercophora sp. LCS_1]
MTLPFSTPPPSPLTPTPFTLSIPSSSISQLHTLIRNTPLAPANYYTTHPNASYGVTLPWLQKAANAWLDYDWPAREAYFNTIPQFTVDITSPSDGQVFNIHFAALFSKKQDAVPVVLLHGWPSSWLDYLEVFEIIKNKYTEDTLPYHVVVPSIPDYGLSTRSGIQDKELGPQQAGEILNELMKGLGFGSGYVGQGGDVGGVLNAVLGTFDECKALLFNNILLSRDQRKQTEGLPVTEEEGVALQRAATFFVNGTGYMVEQGTRPGTIGLILETNPLALLAWIGEKYVEDGHPLETILEQVSWYWYTRSYARSLWPYPGVQGALGGSGADMPTVTTKKPLGYSWYPEEVLTNARSWIEHLFPNLVFYSAHDKGGHLAALQNPQAFWGDIEAFVDKVKTEFE